MNVKQGVYERDGLVLDCVEVFLENTTLIVLSGYGSFVMCGALDVDIYNTPKMVARQVICAKAVGVKTLDELYEAEIYQASNFAQSIGWKTGMKIKDAFEILAEK